MATSQNPAPTSGADRGARLLPKLAELFEDVAGVSIEGADGGATFMELGLDSLALTQVAQQLQKAFGVKVTFRELMEEHQTVDALARHLAGALPPEPDVQAPAPTQAAPAAATNAAPPPAVTPAAPSVAPVAAAPAVLPYAAPRLPIAAPPGTFQAVIDQQLALMQQQLMLLSGGLTLPTPQAAPVLALATPVAAPVAASAPAPAPPPAEQRSAAAPRADQPAATPAAEEPGGAKKAFGAGVRIRLSGGEQLTPSQRARLDAFIHRYTARTKSSKAYTQANRAHLADPRAVTGFRPIFKELIYPIVTERSAGSKLWDIDGNEYVDVLCGFGSNYFGWQPPFIVEAIKRQIDSGYQIGPQHALAGEVAKMFCELTGHDRAAFCNTGSEAVMGCMRIARTVTARDLIATFAGDYHGIFDEVIVRGTKKLKAVPAASGILPNTSQNILVLDYGTPETLEILRSKADELAAVLVEPVQSRRPDLQPREFLHELRALTREAGSVLIFDEVVCGFRVHPRGAQGYFDIQADLASYGKVIGGGYPIGVIAGKRQYMDALDGGHWQYGDDSAPTVGVTYFAGTFVRHPLALTAAKAVLQHLQAAGGELQEALSRRTAAFVDDLNAHFQTVGAPIQIRRCTSFWKPFYSEEPPFGELLFFNLRDRGVHILDGFPCFFTTAHSDEDVAFVARAFKEAVAELQEGGFLPGSSRREAAPLDASRPPVPEARIGRDRDGTPAWFVPNPDEPGKYVRVEAK